MVLWILDLDMQRILADLQVASISPYFLWFVMGLH
jgi:hypothetical protein